MMLIDWWIFKMKKINLDGIKKVFEQFIIEENQVFMNIMTENFDDLPSCDSGIIACKFIEKNKLMIKELIPKIQNLVDDKSFQSWIVQLEKNKAKEELKVIKNKLETTNYNKEEKAHAIRFYKPQIERCRDLAENLNFEKFISNCEELFNSLLYIDKNDLEFYQKYHIYSCVAKILFEDYKRDKTIKNRFNIPRNNPLEKLYQENGINLNNIDIQYYKYKLFTIDNNFEISVSSISKVYDKRFNIYLVVKEIQEKFLQLLKELKGKGYISSLALRPEYTNVSKDLKNPILKLQEKEFGKIFSFENLGNPTITKLYSTDKYDNKLWIIIDEENITFEELLENFDVHNNSIVTQVIHLQYKKEENNYIIHHIDHEYIFYTEDEYVERENNPMQKGEAKIRYKTFKIDNSKIPFILDDGSFFLYRVLDTYFVNKDLIKEYFEDVLKD